MNVNQYQPAMNNTEWEEIRSAMLDSPNAHQWRTKDIETGYICPWDGEWFYHFKIDGELDSYKSILWLEIKAETEEIRNEVLEILKKIHVPGEVHDKVIRVYGFIEMGKPVDYL
ncbi:DUF6678 family protein [Peribacillus kribbensis]|uniref:DUF6678 family protein n=1 Tax=Peribacillus kribbensis TaxID=356658 RepID=UPI0003FD4CC2|nr:DUF6678 family protein [Peribacillus kribbensis]